MPAVSSTYSKPVPLTITLEHLSAAEKRLIALKLKRGVLKYYFRPMTLTTFALFMQALQAVPQALLLEPATAPTDSVSHNEAAITYAVAIAIAGKTPPASLIKMLSAELSQQDKMRCLKIAVDKAGILSYLAANKHLGKVK